MPQAHNQKTTHSYTIHYPAHPERKDDPHYVDFNAYRRKTKATAKCAVGLARNDYSECDSTHPLELHHSHIEFALQNGIDLRWFEAVYPGVSDPDHIGAWVESGANLEWLCRGHHRGVGGVHRIDASNWEAEKFVRGLVSG